MLACCSNLGMKIILFPKKKKAESSTVKDLEEENKTLTKDFKLL